MTIQGDFKTDDILLLPCGLGDRDRSVCGAGSRLWSAVSTCRTRRTVGSSPCPGDKSRGAVPPSCCCNVSQTLGLQEGAAQSTEDGWLLRTASLGKGHVRMMNIPQTFLTDSEESGEATPPGWDGGQGEEEKAQELFTRQVHRARREGCNGETALGRACIFFIISLQTGHLLHCVC